jgi:hypothetical protein
VSWGIIKSPGCCGAEGLYVAAESIQIEESEMNGRKCRTKRQRCIYPYSLQEQSEPRRWPDASPAIPHGFKDTSARVNHLMHAHRCIWACCCCSSGEAPAGSREAQAPRRKEDRILVCLSASSSGCLLGRPGAEMVAGRRDWYSDFTMASGWWLEFVEEIMGENWGRGVGGDWAAREGGEWVRQPAARAGRQSRAAIGGEWGLG